MVYRKKVDLYDYLRDVLDAKNKYLNWGEEENPLPASLGDFVDTAEAVQRALHFTVHYYAELFWIYTDIIGCYRMAKRYPWDPKYIKRSDHLRFISMLFLQLVYVFEERMKGAIKWSEMIFFLSDTKIDGTKYLKKIKAHLGPRIRARGQHVHQGRHPEERLIFYQAVELMQQQGSFAEGFSLKEHGIRVTRKYLCDQIASELVKMEDILQEFYEQNAPSLAKAIKRFDEFTQSKIQQASRKR